MRIGRLLRRTRRRRRETLEMGFWLWLACGRNIKLQILGKVSCNSTRDNQYGTIQQNQNSKHNKLPEPRVQLPRSSDESDSDYKSCFDLDQPIISA